VAWLVSTGGTSYRLQVQALWPNLDKGSVTWALGGDSSMSKPISALIVGAATTGLLAVSSAAIAAELAVPPPAQRARAAECGPCGCVHVTYDYHRELRSTYGLAFDPRNFDQTQPYYYFGAVRAYPRFWCAIE
jgi:hypothetical protein